MDPIWIFQNLNFSLFSITPLSLSLSLSQLCRRHYHNNQHAKPSLLHWLHLTPAQHCWTHCQLVFSHCLLFLIDKLCLVAWKKKENKLLYNYFLLISSCWFWSLFFSFFFFFFFGFVLGDWFKFLRNCQIEREELGEMKWRINEKKVADWILVRSCICELIRNIVKYILNHFLFFIRKTNITKGYDYFREFIKKSGQ